MPDPRRDETVAATPELGGEVAGIEVEGGAPAGGPRFPLGMRYMAAGALSFSVMSLLVKVAGQRLPSQEMVMVRAVITLILSTWAVRAARVSPCPARWCEQCGTCTRGVPARQQSAPLS
jgi:hypothetical protein